AVAGMLLNAVSLLRDPWRYLYQLRECSQPITRQSIQCPGPVRFHSKIWLYGARQQTRPVSVVNHCRDTSYLQAEAQTRCKTDRVSGDWPVPPWLGHTHRVD